MNSSESLPVSTPTASSPASKRKSSFRKWLSNPVRKRSQGRMDKATDKSSSGETPNSGRGERKSSGGAKIPSIKEQAETPKKTSESSSDDTPTPAAMPQPSSSSLDQPHPSESPQEGVGTGLGMGMGESEEAPETEDEVLAVEMPPAMDEIQTYTIGDTSAEDVQSKLSSSPSLKTQSEGTASMTDLAQEIEKIVKQQLSEDTDISEPTGEGASVDEAAAQSADDSSQTDTVDGADSNMTPEEANEKKYVQKREYVMQELIDTERDYVRDLGLIVEGYMKLIKEDDGTMPEDMEGKDKIVFGNIHQIYDWHKDTFSKEIEKCFEEPERLGLIFSRYERRLYMYVKYCENKPKSEYIVAEYFEYFEELRAKMGHKLQIPDLLIKPVQRIMKYQLLLRDIYKYTEKAGQETKTLKKAVDVMVVVPKAANDMMNVGRLQGFNGKITAQGKLLLQDTLQMMELSSKVKPEQAKFRERRVFLFEQIVIVSEEIEKRRNNLSNPGYIFKNSLKVNKMALKENYNNDPLCFVLIDKMPGSDLQLVGQASTEIIRDNWIVHIRNLLDMQGDFLRALQSPIAYQKELTKELSAPEMSNLQHNSMLRKTQSQPASKTNTLPPMSSIKNMKKSAQKHSRCKSVPGPADDAVNPKKKPSDDANNKSDKDKKSETRKTSVNSSPKPKRTTIFEGFRNTLRPKSKSHEATSSCMASKISAAVISTTSACGASAQGSNCLPLVAASGEPVAVTATTSPLHKGYASVVHSTPDLGCAESEQCLAGGTAERKTWRQSSTGQEDSPSSPTCVMTKTLTDYTAVKEDEISVSRGETVQVLTSNQHNMYFVHRAVSESSPAAEGWIPGHILGHKEGDNAFRKSWHMKVSKKLSFSSDKKDSGSRSGSLDRDSQSDMKLMNPDLLYEVAPLFKQDLSSVVVDVGGTAVFTCRVCGRPRPTVTWHGPNKTELVGGPRVAVSYSEDGEATLKLRQVVREEAGTYTCLVRSEVAMVSSSALLAVVENSSGPGRPVVTRQSFDSVLLDWVPASPSLSVHGYSVQYLETGSPDWQTAASLGPTSSHMITGLRPGVTYQFRIVANCHDRILASSPSDPITMCADSSEDEGDLQWLKTFQQDYVEVAELARGRFSQVKKCVHRMSGQEVAAKMVSKRLLNRADAAMECSVLLGLQHGALLRPLSVYDTATSHVIILPLLATGQLFEVISSRDHFDELEAASCVDQLLDVVQYLHNCRIAHLDVKPENLMVDVMNSSSRVRLIDFGDARNITNGYYVHPLVGSPEFASPELVNGSPVDLSADIWSIGVVVYVLLSGVSPFLDESTEETCSNIVRCDYSFPDDYFAGVSQDARDFISSLLSSEPSGRPSAQMCRDHAWVKKPFGTTAPPSHTKPIATGRLADFVERRRHQNDTCIISPTKQRYGY